MEINWNLVGCNKRNEESIANWNKFKSKATDLPSSHPYWFVQVLLQDKKRHKDLLEKYIESNTSLSDIEKKITRYQNSINILKLINLA